MGGRSALSHSSSALLTSLLYGPERKGTALGPRHLLFPGYVLTLTAPGAPRMPNGIEAALTAAVGQAVTCGDGALTLGRLALDPGTPWEPRPTFQPLAYEPPAPEPLYGLYTGVGFLCGYIAGIVLLHGDTSRAELLANDAATSTSTLGATLLLHAARGEVPEPMHVLLCAGDPRPLHEFGGGYGATLLRGLVAAGYPLAERVESGVPQHAA